MSKLIRLDLFKNSGCNIVQKKSKVTLILNKKPIFLKKN